MWRKVSSWNRALSILISLVLLYLGNLFAGWPVDWWVPVWGVFTADAVLVTAGYAWGTATGTAMLAVSEAHGELQEKSFQERSRG